MATDAGCMDIMRRVWDAEQSALAVKVVQDDDPDRAWDPMPRRVAGFDVSFLKGDDATAVATLVVLALPDLNVVYEDTRTVTLTLPYISGYLAFRECPALLTLWRALQAAAVSNPAIRPDVVLLDGNGVLHPRACGLASHFGVLAGVPTIGVAKTFYAFDGLRPEDVVATARACNTEPGQWVPLVGDSGTVLGAALRPTADATDPVFVSVGHRVSLATAVRVAHAVSLYRVAEPVRQADLRSREAVRALEAARTSGAPSVGTGGV
jgi:endonuclease V